MANINKDGYIKTQDANGNIVTVYPYTKAGNVDGLDVFGASGSNHSTGLVPDPGTTAGSTKYLREDGTWAEPSGGGIGTVTGVKVGTTSYSPDSAGVVSIPAYPNVSGKIDTAGTGLSKSGTTLNHSNSVTAKTTAGAYKIKYDSSGHITGTSSLSYSDVGAASSDHSHSNATTTSAGFMSSSDKSTLNSIATAMPWTWYSDDQSSKLNSFTHGCVAFWNSGTTAGLSSGWVIVETYYLTSSGDRKQQVITRAASNDKKFRYYNGSTWTEWT